MKLNELHLAEDTAEEYLKKLVTTLKISKLGSGAYASVFQHPVYHNVAVKFFSADPMYLKYLKLCQKAQDNPWVPKIVSIHKLKMDDYGYDNLVGEKRTEKEEGYLVFFQKLRRAKASEIKAAIQDILSDLPDPLFYPNDFALFDMARKDFSFELMTGQDWGVVTKWTKRPEIKQIARILTAVDANDIHSQNMMMRDEGDRTQLVFTDPSS
jgi:hypothetical protein